MEKPRWSGLLAYGIALVASAVGLGNVWRFSYLLILYGRWFLLFYLLLAPTLGVALLFLENFLGAKYRKRLDQLFRSALGPFLSLPVYLSLLLTLVMGSYYSVLVAQTLGAALGLLHLSPSVEPSLGLGVSLLLTWAAAFLVISAGIRQGLERANYFLTGLLSLCLLYLFISSGAVLKIPEVLASLRPGEPLEGFWAALSQVAFSLSAGMGFAYAYSTLAPVQDNKRILWTSFLVALADTLIALMASAVVLSKGLEMGVPFGENLAFVVLGEGPLALPFFLLLFAAGFTSLLAMLEFGRLAFGVSLFLPMVVGSSLTLLLPQAVAEMDHLVTLGLPLVILFNLLVYLGLFLGLLPGGPERAWR